MKLITFFTFILIFFTNAYATPPVNETGKDLGGTPLPTPWIDDEAQFPGFPNHRELAERTLSLCENKEIEDDCYAIYFNWIASGQTLLVFTNEFNRLNSVIATKEAEIEDLQEQCLQDVTQYIYKPVSEADGNVVVLTNPAAEVTIVGNITETLNDRGESNGFATTARSRNRCNAFGNDVTLELRINGTPARPIFIGDGCIRQEKR